MTDAEFAARQHASHVAFYERVAGRIERFSDTLLAAVSPGVPDRSLPNAVLYEDPADVVAALPELEQLYADAGVRAWTVWVHPGHDELAAALAAAGHHHDGQPMQMGARLDEIDLTPADGLQVEPVTDWPVVGELNDRAYGIVGGFGDLLVDFGGCDGGWLAIVDGEPAATVTVLENDGDAYVALVATDPRFRGRGLCRGLMAHALRVARDNGCTTTTLEGSPMGEPIYARLGYRSLGRLGLWERRTSNNSA